MDKVRMSLLACVLMCVGCNEISSIADRSKNDVKPEPVSVNVVQVQMVEDISLRTYVGRAEASQDALLHSSFPGKVKQLKVRNGSFVKAGDLLLELESESVKSAYEMASASLEQARDGYDRMMQVYPKGGVTEVQKMEITTQFRKAEASFKSAQDALERCSVKAPYSGIVEEVFVEEGVELGVSSPLVRILNSSSVEIHFSVPENEIRSIRLNGMAEVEFPAAGMSLNARVIAKGVQASAVSHSYECILTPERNCADILPGMVCKVRMKSDTASRLILPVRALMSDNRGRYVWCASREGVISKRYVEPGSFTDNGVTILSGLEEGELVVVDGFRKVSSGMKVKIKQL
ncbi:MAG: efflux RND transporter periplasmic adaptor subunit [Candidatus Cryptobacteroides sp.]